MEDDPLRQLGRRIRELRQQREISQEDLAASAGLHRTYVSSLERGERNPTVRTLLKLCRALEVDLSALTERIG